MTVNITCLACDGQRLCEACRNAARTLSEAGFRVEHSTRYAALRAAASGTYGFDACVVPIGSNERAVIDAAVALFSGKRLAFVVDKASDLPANAAGIAAVMPRERYAAGEFDLSWLTDSVPISSVRRPDEIAASVVPREPREVADGADQSHATRRLKRVADAARKTIATAGFESVPRLDLFAVLEDEIAWARASSTAFGIILAHLHGVSAPKTGERRPASEKRLREAEAAIARAVRLTDVVSGRGDDFLVVLPEADAAGVSLAVARVSHAISTSGLHAASKPKRARGFAAWSVGKALYPADGTTRDSLLARATATLKPINSWH